MNDTVVTVIGNVVADPRHRVTANGIHVATIRLATTSRKFDRGAGEWRDNNTIFFSVSCWRSLAANVVASVRKGHPLVVTGRLRMNSYTTEAGESRTSPEIDANSVGHDLGRGVAHFKKAQRYVAPERRAAVTEESDPWEAPPQNEGSIPSNETDKAEAGFELSGEATDSQEPNEHRLTEISWDDPSEELARLSVPEEPAAA